MLCCLLLLVMLLGGLMSLLLLLLLLGCSMLLGCVLLGCGGGCRVLLRLLLRCLLLLLVVVLRFGYGSSYCGLLGHTRFLLQEKLVADAKVHCGGVAHMRMVMVIMEHTVEVRGHVVRWSDF